MSVGLKRACTGRFCSQPKRFFAKTRYRSMFFVASKIYGWRNSSCEVNDLVHQLQISLTRLDGQLLGQLTADLGGCTCWHDAPVRLFDGQGLVSSSQVSPEGFFSLAIPDPARRYSLGLVLPREGIPELQIIGQIDRE